MSIFLPTDNRKHNKGVKILKSLSRSKVKDQRSKVKVKSVFRTATASPTLALYSWHSACLTARSRLVCSTIIWCLCCRYSFSSFSVSSWLYADFSCSDNLAANQRPQSTENRTQGHFKVKYLQFCLEVKYNTAHCDCPLVCTSEIFLLTYLFTYLPTLPLVQITLS